MTLYSAWKDVVENPRPDGVPSKTLQPAEFKAWQDTNTAEGAPNGVTSSNDSATKSEQDKGQAGSKLRLKA